MHHNPQDRPARDGPFLCANTALPKGKPMNKTIPVHLNSVFDISVWIDRSYADDQVLEIVAYPMAVQDSLDNGERIGSIDTNHMVASLRLPVTRLARNELERKALMGHVG